MKAKPRQANDGDESPEGVIDSASLNAQPDEDFEQQEGASKKTRKRRQRRRKHKNKKQEGEDAAQKQGEAQPDQQEYQHQPESPPANQEEYFVDENQQRDVDELNYGMEMELDKSEIQ